MRLATSRRRLVNGFGPTSHGPYFKNQVRAVLVERFGWERCLRGGLRVYTTHRHRMQQAAEKALADGLADIETAARMQAPSPRRPGRDSPAPPISRARSSRSIRDRRDARDGRRPRLRREPVQPRDPGAPPAGSAFKPFVYAAALESGLLARDTDHRSRQSDDGTLDGRVAARQTDTTTSTAMTMRTALADVEQSRRRAGAAATVGMPETVSYATPARSQAPRGAVAGRSATGDVTVLSMTSAYGGVRERRLAAGRRSSSAASRIATAASSTPMRPNRSRGDHRRRPRS